MTRVIRVSTVTAYGPRWELKEIGAYDDEATRLRGVRRLELSDADAEARRRVVQWMVGAGLEVRVDRIGNVYATRPGRDRSLPCVLMGSHIDTVATGGAFDGTLGVLGGIEVMRTLNDEAIETLRDIEVGFFTEEEGVRFGIDMLGSAVTAGRIPLNHAHKLTDDDGKTVKEELVRIGFDGEAHELRSISHAYIECHIEQGPILADAGVDVGIVEGVQSISWQRLTIRGEASHAGTAPFGQLRATVGNFSSLCAGDVGGWPRCTGDLGDLPDGNGFRGR